MASAIRTPTLALAVLSMCLSMAMIGTAGRSLNIFNDEHHTEDWLLPLWPNHFDTRELNMIMGTSATIFVLNAFLAISLFLSSLPANAIVIGSSALSTIVSIISIAFSVVITQRAPHRDTLHTWTCRWSDSYIKHGQWAPKSFQSLCYKTRFAYYTTIPILVIQVALLALGLYAIFARPANDRHRDLEKTRGHQLREVSSSRHNTSFDAKSDRSYQDSARILGSSKA